MIKPAAGNACLKNFTDNPVHIALFLPNLKGGGAERVMVQLATGFAQHGLKVDLVLVKATGAYLPQVHPEVKIVDLNAANTYLSILGLIPNPPTSADEFRNRFSYDLPPQVPSCAFVGNKSGI